ncbi:MAG: hypothetical protein ACFFD5_12705 [Candidatus Thorarchaeota archaeon]
MVRKGKYKLLSYFIEDSLIFYKSMKKSKSYVAFSVLRALNLINVIEILVDFLKRKILNYYSIQISLSENEENLLILCFQDVRKSTIIKSYNLIRERILETNKFSQFLSNKELENAYFNIIQGIKNPNIKICCKHNKIFIKSESTIKILECYDLDLKSYKKREPNLYFLLNLFKDCNKRGHFIFNFKSNDVCEILLSAFYVNKLKNEDDPFSNLDSEINRFFDENVLLKYNLCINDIANLLWRLKLSKNQFLSINPVELFNFKHKENIRDLDEFNIKFENKLNQSKIHFQRLSPNLLFIEQKVLFMTLLTLDVKLILNLSKNFYSKYKIYILFLDDEEYQRIEKVDKVKELDNLKILNYDDYNNFKIDIFKNELFLENT